MAAADTTAAAATGSDAPPTPQPTASDDSSDKPSSRGLFILSGVFLVALVTLGLVFELGGEERIIADGALPLPELPSTELTEAGPEAVAASIRYTPEFEIEAATTLELTLSRSAEEGWVSVDCALVNQETSEIRELGLVTEVRQRAAGSREDERSTTALIDQVEPGRYVVRLSPRWEPVAEPVPGRGGSSEQVSAPTATLRITEGKRTPWAFLLAAALLAAPPAFAGIRRLRR